MSGCLACGCCTLGWLRLIGGWVKRERNFCNFIFCFVLRIKGGCASSEVILFHSIIDFEKCTLSGSSKIFPFSPGVGKFFIFLKIFPSFWTVFLEVVKLKENAERQIKEASQRMFFQPSDFI